MIKERNKNIKEITFKYNISALTIYKSVKDYLVNQTVIYCNRRR